MNKIVMTILIALGVAALIGAVAFRAWHQLYISASYGTIAAVYYGSNKDNER